MNKSSQCRGGGTDSVEGKFCQKKLQGTLFEG